MRSCCARPASALGWKEGATKARTRLPQLGQRGNLVRPEPLLLLTICATRGGLGCVRVRTCFQLRAVLTLLANRASPSEVPAAPPAVIGTRSQLQRSKSTKPPSSGTATS